MLICLCLPLADIQCLTYEDSNVNEKEEMAKLVVARKLLIPFPQFLKNVLYLINNGGKPVY